MKQLNALACALALASASTAAFAADEWTGPYAGLSAGHAEYVANWLDVDYDWYGGNFATNEKTQNVGLQFGYNKQINNWVVGGEFSYNHVAANSYMFYSQDVWRTDDLESVMSLKAKAGIAVDKTMLYVTAGLAQVDANHRWTEVNDVPDSWVVFDNDGIGSVAGFGLETKVGSNFSVRSEVLRGRSPGTSSTNPNGFTMTVTEEFTFINVGANFLF